MNFARLALLALVFGGTTSCQTLSFDSRRDGIVDFLEDDSVRELPAERIVIIERYGKSTIADVCRRFELPNNTDIPSIDTTGLSNDPDQIISRLIAHVAQLNRYMDERNAELDKRYAQYLKDCGVPNVVNNDR